MYCGHVETGTTTFLAATIRAHPEGGFTLDQEEYAKDMLRKWKMADCRSNATPGDAIGLELETLKEEDPDPEDVKLAQMLAGAFIWLSTRTRPDLAYVQHRISSLAVRAPKRALSEGKGRLRYLSGTTNLALRYQKTDVKG